MQIKTFSQDKFYFQLYDNIDKLTWQQIKEKTKCYALCNLWYFNLNTYEHDVGVMLEGKWVRTPAYDWPGICIDKEGKVTTGGTTSSNWSYAASVQADYLDKRKNSSVTWEANGVTYTGLKENGDVVVLLNSKDTPITSETAVQAMLDEGCVDILRWDGSWSSQGSLGDGIDIQPSQKRICRGYLLIFKKEEEEMDTGNKIIENYIKQNRCYTNQIKCNKTKMMLHSTGTPGGTAEGIRNGMNSSSAETSVEFVIDDTGIYQLLPLGIKSWHCGASANNTHIACEICEPIQTRLIDINWVPLYRNNKNNPTWAVTQLQKELQAWGYDPNGIDGNFGPGCEAAVKQFQKDNGLSVDGSVGPATKLKLSARENSYLKYNPDDPEVKKFFDNVYNKAVYLFAYILKQVGGKANEIVCHAEGYQQGIASNHADVNHWFPLHGKTMDAFRSDVEKALNNEGDENMEDNILEGVADWAKEAWEKAYNKIGTDGKRIIDGTRPTDNITRQEMVVILDRLGLL